MSDLSVMGDRFIDLSFGGWSCCFNGLRRKRVDGLDQQPKWLARPSAGALLTPWGDDSSRPEGHDARHASRLEMAHQIRMQWQQVHAEPAVSPALKKSQISYIMTTWSIELHELADAELRALPTDMQARFLRIAELLQELGPQQVGMPHIRPLEDKLWEIRMNGRDGISRAIYAAIHGRTLLVLHVFTKRTQKTPRSAIKKAHERLKVQG